MSNVIIGNYCNKASNRIVPKQKELVSSSGYSSYTKWVDFPHTHTSTHANFKNLLYIRCTPRRIYPFIGGESDVLWKEEQILDRQ